MALLLGRGARAVMLASVAAAVPLTWFVRGRHGLALFCLFALVTATLAPRLGRRMFGTPMPARLELVWLLPFVACWGFGEGWAWFERIAWWDRLTHTLGGAAVYALFVHYARGRVAPRRLLCAVGVLMALAVGALWEIGEFTSDSLFGTATQHGNTDTMGDLIFDLAGGLVGLAIEALAGSLAAGWARARALLPRASPLRAR